MGCGGCVPGAIVGLFQWPVLRQVRVHAGPWIGATAVGLGVVHAIGDALPDAIALPIIQASGGIMLGLLQWLLLRRVVPTAWWWGGTSSMGWAIGLSAGLSIAYASGLMHGPWTPTTGMLQHGVVGAVTGIGYGVMTGSALVRLRRAVETG